MLSIIVSSNNSKFFLQLEKSIQDTVAIPYEIVRIDNPGKMGICAAYNLGAKQAAFKYLLFLHEDIIFHTRNWGKSLIAYLEKSSVGLVGIAGSSYVPVAPSGWHLGNKYDSLNLIQNNKQGTDGRLQNFNANTLKKVFALDGVFLAIRKEVFEKYHFNEKIIGFHGYDIDLSMRVAKKFDNYVIPDILIEHFSVGNPDKEWFNEILIARKKYGANYNKIIDEEIEFSSYKKFVINFINFKNASIKNFIKVLYFFPFKRISFKLQLLLLKEIYKIFRSH